MTGKAKKYAARIALGLAIACAALIATALFVQARVERRIQRELGAQLSKLFQTEARVGAVEWQWVKSRFLIRELALANPPGYSAPHALEIPRAAIDYRFGSLFGAAPTLESILLAESIIEFEPRLTQTNLTDLLNAALQAPPSGRRYLIREIRATGAELRLRAGLLGEKPLSVALGEIVIENLSPDNTALSLERAAALFMLRLLQNALLQTRDELARRDSFATNWLIPVLDWVLEDWRLNTGNGDAPHVRPPGQE